MYHGLNAENPTFYNVLFKSAVYQPQAGEGAGHHQLIAPAPRVITYNLGLGCGDITINQTPGRDIIFLG